jgi:bile acid-coenzyme A ligase
MAAVSFARALGLLVEQDPHAIALVCAEQSMTRGELDRASTRLARIYAQRGVRQHDLVTIALPNGLEWFVACMAAWKLGAVPNPIASHLPALERNAILQRANPALVVGLDESAAEGRAALPAGFVPDATVSDEPLPDLVAPVERVLTSGGSTGLPKLIVAKSPAVIDPDSAMVHFFTARSCALAVGPLYHGVPYSASWRSLLGGAKVVVMQRFDASLCLQLIEQHRVDRVCFVPTMMARISRLPEQERRSRDLSSLEFVATSGAPCPPWLMEMWINWLGPKIMHDSFGSTERLGGTIINGTEWLAHPGSVGRAVAGSRIRILDPKTGTELPLGTMGEIYMMPPTGPGTTSEYVGAEARQTADGWQSVGDMGYLDAEGYLYLGDRRTDMILCRGRNIYPAEIEAAIEAHPKVRSSAVIGLPDDDLGQRIHALVELAAAVSDEELKAHVRERLAHYKIPASFEVVEHPLRNDAGKVRRYALREARLEGSAASKNRPEEAV